MDIRLPNLGEGADSGTVVNIFVKEGDPIAKDQPVIELENEKAVASIPSPAAGTVGTVYVKVGDKISVGQRLLSLGEGAGTAAAKPAAKQEPTATEPESPEPATKVASEQEPVSTKDMGLQSPPPPPRTPGVPPPASPAIRKLARDLGIDLLRVRGSARGGRILLEDVRAYIQRLQRLAAEPRSAAPAPGAAPAQPARSAAEKIDFAKWGPVEKKPVSPLRQVIARRMAENWNAIPHVTQFDSADITDLNALRKKYAPAYEQKGARLTLTSFAIKAVVDTLKKHPIFNTSLGEESQEIVFKRYYHIGIAVDTEAGLIVPVIRDADKKNLLELSNELERLAEKARTRKISSEELKGGTFTISNQGGIGGAHFTPIVNKPEVAILGLGRGAMQAVVRPEGVAARLLMPIGLSYDHRVIDGGSAARFTVDLVKAFHDFKEDDVKL